MKKIDTTQQKIRLGIQGAVLALLVIAVAIYGVHQQKPSHAATITATLSASPSSGTYTVGSTISVAIFENSSTEPVSTVQADITYDSTALAFVPGGTANNQTDDTGSQFTDIAPPPIVGTGTLSVSRGAITAQTGNQKVTTVNFTVLKAGTATISFAGTSQVYRDSDLTNIYSGGTPATYVFQNPCTAVPSTPGTPTVSAKTDTSVALSWTASTAGANCTLSGYHVFRGATKVADIAAGTTTYTDTGLTASTAYSYTVTASDALSHTSAASAALAVTTNAPPCTLTPSVPASLQRTVHTTTSVTITWAASTPAANCTLSGYHVFRGATKVADIAAGTTTYTDTGLTASTTYSYTVTASDTASHTSAASAILTAGTGVLGDADGDGSVNSRDIATIVHYWTQHVTPGTNGDLSGNGIVDSPDIAALVKYWPKS
jgi:hypothetical protein